jgi:alkylation response protein AidB-like acyl-CoA dehydrogenase
VTRLLAFVCDNLRRVSLAPEEQTYVETIARFIDRDARPVVRELEHSNTFPADLVARMRDLGVYGLVVPEEYGGTPVSTSCFALVAAELARGWMSLAGTMGPHSVVCTLITAYGTDEQKKHWLPRLATGEIRGAMALTEPGGGSDLQGMRTVARRQADGSYLVTGGKTWITNARRAGVIALLCKTNPDASPAHRGVSLLLVEPGPGFTVSRDLPKLGYKGVESCELSFDGYVAPPEALLGGEEGNGFAQMMRGLELGRIQVSARAVGVAQAALDDAVAYSQVREAFGKPIWEHQAVGHLLATMATKVEAARRLMLYAAERYDAGERSDMEAGMSKLFASEVCLEVTADAMRVHGGYGYSPEFDVERYYRDAPLMVLGEGTNEIQKNVIARQLIARSRKG